MSVSEVRNTRPADRQVTPCIFGVIQPPPVLFGIILPTISAYKNRKSKFIFFYFSLDRKE